MAQRLIALLFFAGLVASAIVSSEEGQKVVVCYYGSWAVYRPWAGAFDVEDIDPSLCTHIVYEFSGLSGYKGLMISLDPFNDLYEEYGKGAYYRFNKLKEMNPNAKTLLALGGWSEGSTKFSLMVSTAEGRTTFLVNAVDFLKEYGFDGLNLAWDFPGRRGGDTADKANLALLLSEMREIFDQNGLMMTAAVSGQKDIIDAAYDIPALAKYLDQIHVMCYDYHGAWEPFTGHNSPLFWNPEDMGEYSTSNANFSLHYWIENGAPPEKLVMGIPFYGRTFLLEDETVNGLYAPAPKPGLAGPYTRERGFIAYNEICDQMKYNQSAWNTVVDPYYLAPYSVKNTQWIGYDDIESVRSKAEFAASLGLQGAMAPDIEDDDFRGGCHGEKFPLLKAIWLGLNGEDTPPTPPDISSTEETPGTIPTYPTKPETTSTTTTRRPPPPPTEICKKEGLNADPTGCENFYLCTPTKYGGWSIVKYRCGPGTVFDPAHDICNWPSEVPGCEDYGK